MSHLSILKEGYQRFRDGAYNDHSNLYNDLGDGQAPPFLVISCSDSRVDPAEIFNMAPGNLFMVRNIANIAPPSDAGPISDGTAAALEYGVKALGVGLILVLGHTGCGGINALSSKCSTDTSIGHHIDPWIDIAKPAFKEGLSLAELEKASVRQSLENLRSYDFISDKVNSADLELVGAIFDIGNGSVEFL